MLYWVLPSPFDLVIMRAEVELQVTQVCHASQLPQTSFKSGISIIIIVTLILIAYLQILKPGETSQTLNHRIHSLSSSTYSTCKCVRSVPAKASLTMISDDSELSWRWSMMCSKLWRSAQSMLMSSLLYDNIVKMMLEITSPDAYQACCTSAERSATVIFLTT